MATKKKLDFDFSKFGCNEGAVKDLIGAMGFEAKDEGVYVSPLDRVKRRDDDKILLVVTTGLHELEYGNLSNNYIPVVEEPFYRGGAPRVNGIPAEALVTEDGRKIIGFVEDN